MNIYLLFRKDDCGFDEMNSMVIEAETNKMARIVANGECGDEGKIWTDVEQVLVKLIGRGLSEGKKPIVHCTDYIAG